MFCPNCGKEQNNNDARFCDNCGNPIGNKTSRDYSQTNNNTDASIHAGFFLRLIAFIIDVVVFTIIFGVLSVGGGVGNNVHTMQGASFLIGLLLNSAFESSQMMGTPGKYFLKIAVVDVNRQRISFSKALIRNICEYLNVFTFFIGYLMIGFTQNKQGLHDMIAGTYVIRKGR